MASKFKDGDLVWAKIKGHPPWPAFVDSRNGVKKNKVTVRFFGSDEVGFIVPNNVFPYEKHKEKFAKSKKNKTFIQALTEIEQHASQLRSSQGISDIGEDIPIHQHGEIEDDKQDILAPETLREPDDNVTNNKQDKYSDDAVSPVPANDTSTSKTKKEDLTCKISIKRKTKSKAKTTSKKPKISATKETDHVESPSGDTNEAKDSQFGLITSKMMEVVKKESQSRFDVSSDDEDTIKEVKHTSKDREYKGTKDCQSPTVGIKLKISIGAGTASVVTDNTNGKDNGEEQKKLEKEKRKAEKLQQKIAKKEAEKEKRKQALKEKKKKELLARKMEGKKHVKEENKSRDLESNINDSYNETNRSNSNLEATEAPSKVEPHVKETYASAGGDSYLKGLSQSLRESMRVDSPDIKRCLAILDDIKVTDISADAIIKNKDLILTIKKLRRYKANEEIMMKADNLYRQVKEMASRLIENPV